MKELGGVLQLGGMAAVIYGMYLWSLPASLVVGGFLLMLAGVSVSIGGGVSARASDNP